MRAIVLAAGRGSRMNEETAYIPKCMIELFGAPLLDHCLASLEAAGFARADIGIVTGYRSERIRAERVRQFHNGAWASTNMFVSLTMAAEWLRQEPCIVCYSDIFFHPSAVCSLMMADADLAITYYTGFWELWSQRFANPLDDLETFKVADGHLTEIGARPRSKDEVQGQYMGLLRFTPAGWRAVEEMVETLGREAVQRIDLTGVLRRMTASGSRIAAIRSEEQWLECDSMEDVRLYEKEYVRRG